MISRVCQWPFEAHAFIALRFPFRKNIVSVNLRGVAALACHHRCFIRLILAGKIVDDGVRCMRRASAFRRLRVSRYVGQFLSVLLRAFTMQREKTRIFTHTRSSRCMLQRFKSSAFSFMYKFLFTVRKYRQRQIMS